MGLRLDDLEPEQETHPFQPSRTFLELLGDLEGSRAAYVVAMMHRAEQELGRPFTQDEVVRMGLVMVNLADAYPAVRGDFRRVCTYVRSLEDEVRKLQSTIVDLTTK